MTGEPFMPNDPWRRTFAIKEAFKRPEDSLERLLADMLLEAQDRYGELEDLLFMHYEPLPPKDQHGRH